MSDHTPRTIEIQLTQGYETLIDELDADLASMRWIASVNRSKCVYAKRIFTTNGRRSTAYLHRQIYERVLGRQLNKHEEIDHIDGNTLNNERANLRVCTHRQNVLNSKTKSSNVAHSKGIRKRSSGKWEARIRIDAGVRLHLGSFATLEEAREAYKAAALKYHGEFANFG